MRLTIIPSDNTVYVDGVAYTVDCSGLNFHALQWADDAGEVEYAPTRCDHCGARSKKGNEFVRDFTPYQPYVDAWRAAKKADDEAKAAADQAKALFAQEAGANAAGPQG